jgi:flavodoxin
MKILVVYYSLSGTTRRVAEALAKELGADLAEIRCERYRLGPLGFIKAAYDSWADRLPAIAVPQNPSAVYDLIVVGGPMWAMRVATPVRAYLRQEAGRFARVAFLMTLGGAPSDNAFREMEALAKRPPVAMLALSDRDLKAGKLAASVQGFAAGLKARQAA